MRANPAVVTGAPRSDVNALELSVSEDVGPILFDALPHQFADIERINARGYPIGHEKAPAAMSDRG
jgi:hypothetical protein